MCNFQDDYVIEYKRINHYDFKFLLKMQNPNRVEKKVIIRLWLVPTNRTSSTARYHPTTGFVNIWNLVNFNKHSLWIQFLNVGTLYRTYNPKEAIALDRFVYKMTGRENEVIVRNSTQSALTMKEAGLTLEMWVKSLFGIQHISKILNFKLKERQFQDVRECEIK